MLLNRARLAGRLAERLAEWLAERLAEWLSAVECQSNGILKHPPCSQSRKRVLFPVNMSHCKRSGHVCLRSRPVPSHGDNTTAKISLQSIEYNRWGTPEHLWQPYCWWEFTQPLSYTVNHLFALRTSPEQLWNVFSTVVSTCTLLKTWPTCQSQQNEMASWAQLVIQDGQTHPCWAVFSINRSSDSSLQRRSTPQTENPSSPTKTTAVSVRLSATRDPRAMLNQLAAVPP